MSVPRSVLHTVTHTEYEAVNIIKATVGDGLTLSCSFPPSSDRSSGSGAYLWYNVTGAKLLLPSTTGTLTVSKNVTAVGEVGGQRYTCQCNRSNSIIEEKEFWIWGEWQSLISACRSCPLFSVSHPFLYVSSPLPCSFTTSESHYFTTSSKTEQQCQYHVHG